MALITRAEEFADALRVTETVLSGWASLPEPRTAAEMALGGFRAVVCDMQHGPQDEASVLASIPMVSLAGAVPGVRIPVGRFDFASRALDAGAMIIIAPMINTVEDARAFVAATKFPPVGARSWGPSGALGLLGVDGQIYLERANHLVFALAMIETLEAEANLDAILAVEGLDGVFFGPSDFSITLSDGAALEPGNPEVIARGAAIAEKAAAAGKIPGAYATDIERARTFADKGFRFIAVGSDARFVRAGAAQSSKL